MMTNEISATKAELANDLVSLVKTNRDLMNKMLLMQTKIDEFDKRMNSREKAYSHQHGRLLEVRSHLRTVKKELKMLKETNKVLTSKNKA